jgi:DNA invertase Pin-like site-specific DNA recombinase
MTRVRCYYRYSSDEQSDGWSIEAQDKACRSFIALRPDWELAGSPYIDEAWSGKTVNRPAFQQMLVDARSGQFDVLVCHKLDRFSRNLVDVLLTLDELQKLNVSFASATEAIDFTTPSGRMMLVMLAFFAEWYLQNLSVETTKGKLARFEAGYWNGDLRFGYSKAESGQEIKNGMIKRLYKPVPNADARFVVMAYELAAAGKTDQEVADELNRAGSRTYRLISNAKIKAGPEVDLALRRTWTKDSMITLFSREACQFYTGNTVYIGEKERKKAERLQELQIREGTHEAIISKDLCERMQAARTLRVTPGRLMTPQYTRLYLLGGGIAHCACCERPMRCTSSKLGKQYLYYRCASWMRGEDCGAPRIQIREEDIEVQLDPYMAALTLPDDWRQRVQEMIKSDKSTTDWEKRRNELRAQLRRLNYQFEHGLIEEKDVPDYEKKAQHLIKEINSIVVPNHEHVVQVGEAVIALCASWTKAAKEKRRAMLKEMFEAVYIDPANKKVVGVKPYAEFVPLFQQTRMIEHDYRFVLENETTAQDDCSSERSYVSSGSDGRRLCASHMRHTSPSRVRRVRSNNTRNSGCGLMPAMRRRSVSTITAAHIACTISRRMYLLAVGQICRKRTMRSPASTVRAGAGMAIVSICSFSDRARRSMPGRSSSSTMPTLIW